MSPSPRNPARRRVPIACGGVAGLEALLALDALAANLLSISILATELKFINLSMGADQPFKPERVRGLRLEKTAAELGARWHQGRSTVSSTSATSGGRV